MTPYRLPAACPATYLPLLFGALTFSPCPTVAAPNPCSNPELGIDNSVTFTTDSLQQTSAFPSIALQGQWPILPCAKTTLHLEGRLVDAEVNIGLDRGVEAVTVDRSRYGMEISLGARRLMLGGEGNHAGLWAAVGAGAHLDQVTTTVRGEAHRVNNLLFTPVWGSGAYWVPGPVRLALGIHSRWPAIAGVEARLGVAWNFR